jgi:phosphoglucomutase
MAIDPRAGTLAPPAEIVDLAKLESDFFSRKPDAANPAQRVAFGTSGHRGSSLDTSFNENHIAAITQAICDYRAGKGIDGPLYVGRDTHALSGPAFHVALEVLTANGVNTLVDADNGYTPTPVISHAILTYNKGRAHGLADGIVITPSHNPPTDGGFKYNPPEGGPASTQTTGWIQDFANKLLAAQLAGVKRSAQGAKGAPHDFVTAYTCDLGNVVDMDVIRAAGVRIGVDPLGGAAVGYWQPIAARYGINLTMTDGAVDPTFKTVPRDWDGKIRMDCSSPYPMSRLLARKDEFDIAFANDTDADRHGIVTHGGLMLPNDYLATCAYYLGQQREKFQGRTIGKTVVSSSMINRVGNLLKTKVYEVPVGFKWFVDGLIGGEVYFSGEESAGSSFLRRDGSVWTTDKDGLIAGLLAAEITAKTGHAPDKFFAEITDQVGKAWYARIDQPADAALRGKLSKVTKNSVTAKQLGGDPVTNAFTNAPGNDAPIGGIKLETAKGWIAARPSGTEDIYKIYAESFVSAEHLKQLQSDAQAIIAKL